MAREPKTKSAAFDREAWLAGVDPSRRAEAERLLAIFAGATGWTPRLWGPSMVGFGRYVYRYASGHGGESLAVGFAPGKARLSLYGLTAGPGADRLVAGLGPHQRAKACLYLKRLDGVDEAVLAALIRAGLADTATHWPLYPS